MVMSPAGFRTRNDCAGETSSNLPDPTKWSESQTRELNDSQSRETLRVMRDYEPRMTVLARASSILLLCYAIGELSPG
jgi:hypothetical protein